MALEIDYQLEKPIMLEAKFEIKGFTALLGASGAGKTSLLKAIAGLLPATGTPWNGLSPQARPVGYLPQGSALFPHLTVLENAAFALAGVDRMQKASKLLDDLGIGHLAKRQAGRISGGEAQRVALARALGRQPELLLLDEPSAGLDAATRDQVLAPLIETISARNIPALAATHDATIAGLADWLVLLGEARVLQQGTPREVFDNPATVAGARLLGYQNFWVEGARTCCIRAEDIKIRAPGILAVIVSAREQAADLRLTCSMPETITVLLRNGSKSDYPIGEKIPLHFPGDKVKIMGEADRLRQQGVDGRVKPGHDELL